MGDNDNGKCEVSGDENWGGGKSNVTFILAMMITEMMSMQRQQCPHRCCQLQGWQNGGGDDNVG